MKNTGNDIRELQDKIAYLSRFMVEERFGVLRRVLADRTKYITVCLEDVYHPQNASAVIRSCDAFGIQDLHVVEDRFPFRPNTDIVRGTDKWVDIHRYRAAGEGSVGAIRRLREEGYRIVGTSPRARDATPHSFDVEKGKFALFFGTERRGISATVERLADDFIRIPMYGFVESLNLSVCAAILLHTLTERVRTRPRTDWMLKESERTDILFRWMRDSIRDSGTILERYAPDWRDREAAVSLSDYL